MLLTHARFDDDKARKVRKRINKLYKKKKVKVENEETGEEETIVIEPVDLGVSFEQVQNFQNFIKNIHDVEIAFTFFAMTVSSILIKINTNFISKFIISLNFCHVDF